MLIGFSGYGQSGKDSSADILIKHFLYERRAFADPLKEALFRLNPKITHATRLREIVQVEGWEYAKKYPECRELLQRMGTEVGRELFGENFWVEQALKGIAGMPRVTFTDVRFRSEASAIRDHGGIIVRVVRHRHGPVNSHKSETELDEWPFDYIIQNDGTLEDLETKVFKMMRDLGESQDN